MADNAHNIGELLRDPFQAFVRDLHDELAEAGFPDVRPAHGVVFQYIGAEGARVSNMADRAQLAKQSMEYLVSYLERRGYVERVPDPSDRRAKLVRLTPRGWKVVAAGRQALDLIERRWCEALGEQRFRQLRALLAELNRIALPPRQTATDNVARLGAGEPLPR